MEDIKVYSTKSNTLIVELDGAALEMTREEAEVLFVDLGHCLQDMDIQKYDENMETKDQPHVNQS